MKHCDNVRRCSISRRGIWNIPVAWMVLLLLLTMLGGGPCTCNLGNDPMGFSSSVGVACAVTVDEQEESSTGGTRGGVAKIRSQEKSNSTTTTSTSEMLVKAAKRGLGGGLPGAFAGIVQVLSLMWLRTIINYQIRYGVTFGQAFTSLKNDGGIRRFYQGVIFALVQAPMSRFVSTATNDGVNSFLAAFEATKHWGPERTTLVASVMVGMARMLLMPIDTCKTVLQVNSAEGFRSLMRRVKAGKIGVLYQGAFATSLSAFVGHYPWFYTFNLLSKSELIQRAISSSLLRNGFIGFVSSIVSDVVVNAIRVVKTTKQSMGTKNTLSYSETINVILAADGYKGLFGRGLRTRIYANALQSVVFTVIWRGLAERK